MLFEFLLSTWKSGYNKFMEEKIMEPNKISGILSVILGLFFIIFPFFSTGVVSMLIGISLIFFGIALILAGFTAGNIIIGILAILCRFVFTFNIIYAPLHVYLTVSCFFHVSFAQ